MPEGRKTRDKEIREERGRELGKETRETENELS
jgi:hypothetical protein